MLFRSQKEREAELPRIVHDRSTTREPADHRYPAGDAMVEANIFGRTATDTQHYRQNGRYPQPQKRTRLGALEGAEEGLFQRDVQMRLAG